MSAGNGNPFQPEFIQIPYAVFRDPNLSASAKLAYGRLKLYAGTDGQCFMAHRTLAAEICLGRRQTQKILDELRAAGWIDWEWNRGETATYTVWQVAHKSAQGDAQKSAQPLRRKVRKGCAQKCAQNRRSNRGLEKKTTQKLITGCASPKTGEGLPAAALPANGNSKHALSLADMADISKRMADFMDGEAPPKPTQEFVTALATQYNLSAADILGALNAAWQRGAAPGQKNAPRQWKWFNEVLRRVFVPGAAARLPEHPSAGADAMVGLTPVEQAVQEEFNRRATAAFDTLDKVA